MVEKAKKTGKGRKIGRNLKWCQAYRLRRQRERNKAVRLRKHLARLPGDMVAAAALVRCRP